MNNDRGISEKGIPFAYRRENARKICWYHKMKQLTCIFICAILMKILKDKEGVFSKQLFWITPFGVKAIRTAGSTAADGNFGCLID